MELIYFCWVIEFWNFLSLDYILTKCSAVLLKNSNHLSKRKQLNHLLLFLVCQWIGIFVCAHKSVFNVKLWLYFVQTGKCRNNPQNNVIAWKRSVFVKCCPEKLLYFNLLTLRQFISFDGNLFGFFWLSTK